MCPVRPWHTAHQLSTRRARLEHSVRVCASARPRVRASRGASARAAGLCGRSIGSGG
eukprot:CAMPEP_0179881786 /NCGR_PEP_ID=MMETSP0982-20121206/27727_1 /TAXON_ID=483367 /ORGANISM="non described non described, Strain CCMP 2436" /LENGTH=56 /DNA_ID=CAMNT_0021775911 /DNA_START=196 /DNA_END=362 /DNA_ORIENTATION=+